MPRGKIKDRDGIYQRKDWPGTWWGSWIDGSGRRRQRKLEASTLTQARQKLQDLKSKAEDQRVRGYAEPTQDTFAAFSQVFVQYQKRRVAPLPVKGKISKAECRRQEGIVEQHLNPFFGEMKLALIRRKDVAAYIESRIGQVADGTIIKEANTLKRLFTIAVDKELIPSNPAHRAPVPEAPEGRVRYLEPEQLRSVLHACPEWLRPIVGLAVSTGMRRGELLKIRWEDIDTKNGVILLRHTKRGKRRPAFLNALASQVIGSSVRQALRKDCCFQE
jgi:integrase